MILPIVHKPAGNIRDVLAADIGATKTNIALFRRDGEGLNTLHAEKYRTKDFADVTEMIAEFARGTELPARICLGVAGPVFHDAVHLTNLNWDIDARQLSKQFNRPVALVNDLEATACGLAVMNADDVYVLHEGQNFAGGNAAVIAPGTGLGEAGLYWDGAALHPFATEGGHSSFSPATDLDRELYKFLSKIYGHVSWERVLSGPGICDIYDFLVRVKEREEPSWIKEKMLAHDKATVISANAPECAVCNEAMDFFIRYLAAESGSLVLKLKATGGLFIGGGIVPHIIPMIHEDYFEKHFCDFGRMKSLLKSVPVRVILNDKAALLGAAYLGLQQMPEPA